MERRVGSTRLVPAGFGTIEQLSSDRSGPDRIDSYSLFPGFFSNAALNAFGYEIDHVAKRLTGAALVPLALQDAAEGPRRQFQWHSH